MLSYETRLELRQAISAARRLRLSGEVDRCGDAATTRKLIDGGCRCADCYEKRRALRERNRQTNIELERARNRAYKRASRERRRLAGLDVGPAGLTPP